MTEALDWEPILAAIEAGIQKARDDKPMGLTDDYSAFVVLRELHRQGWTIQRNSN